MDYSKHYDNLISRARNRTLSGYRERHHIVPRCMGGSNRKSNIVELTPEEHYTAHQLLVKMHPGNRKLVKAAHMMTTNRPNNKSYGWIKRKFAEVQSDSQLGSGNTQYGTEWIHNDILKKNDKIKAGSPIPQGWTKGRKIRFEKACRMCGEMFPIQGKRLFCSDTCKRHAKAPSNKIIDNNLTAMVDFFKQCHSIDKTLKHFGVTGSRAGNAYLSKLLKGLGLRVRPSNR